MYFQVYITSYSFNVLVFSNHNVSLTLYLYFDAFFRFINHNFVVITFKGISSCPGRLCSDHFPIGWRWTCCNRESLLSLKFGFQLGTVCAEQELLHETGVVCKTILVQNSREEVGLFWTPSAGSYKVIGLSELQLDTSTVLLTNQICHN